MKSGSDVSKDGTENMKDGRQDRSIGTNALQKEYDFRKTRVTGGAAVVYPVEKITHKGRYLMDYGKKYGDPYDVAEKARKHVFGLKKKER